MGVKKVFTSESDLSNLIQGSTEPLKISKVLQKSVLELSETGTKAASANLIKVMTYFGRTQIRFDINRPFFYFIRNKKNGEVLFQGTFGLDNAKTLDVVRKSKSNLGEKPKIDLLDIIQNDGILMSLDDISNLNRNSDDSIKFIHTEEETKNIPLNFYPKPASTPKPYINIFTIFWQTLDNKDENDSQTVDLKLASKTPEVMYGDAPASKGNFRRSNFRTRFDFNPNNYIGPKFLPLGNSKTTLNKSDNKNDGLVFRE